VMHLDFRRSGFTPPKVAHPLSATFPLSREANQLPALRNSLAVYRLVFGQPRQDDLVEFLLQQLSGEELTSRLGQLQIDLTPRDITSTTYATPASTGGEVYGIHPSNAIFHVR
jgi:hypothetical protein